MRVLGVILAGGQARRMGGRDKALIPLGGRTLLEHSIDRLTPQVDEIAVNANGDAARFAGLTGGAPVIADADDSRAGPLAGVEAGFRAAREAGASHVVTAAVDTPFFPDDLVERLVDAANADGHPLACAASGGRTHPVFGLWPVSLHADLKAALASGTRKVDLWTGAHGCAVAEFGAAPSDPFFNVNTPEDLAHAEAMIG